MKSKRTVFEDGDFNRDNRACFILRLGVVLLAELHDIDAVLTQRRTNRRRGIGLTSLNLQLYFANNLFHGALNPHYVILCGIYDFMVV